MLAVDQSAEENNSRYSDNRRAASTQSAQEVQPPPKVHARRKSRISRTAPETEAVTPAKPSPQLVKEINAALALIDSGAADEAL